MAEKRNAASLRPPPHRALKRLERLVGEWEMEASAGGQVLARGRTVFEWMEDGAFLVQRADAAALPAAPPEWTENSPFPVVSLIGLDDSSETFCMLYSDSRGVYRVYRMSLTTGVWRLWRNATGFSQRFTGVFSDDGDTIACTWERSTNASDWEPDFDLTYRRVRTTGDA